MPQTYIHAHTCANTQTQIHILTRANPNTHNMHPESHIHICMHLYTGTYMHACMSAGHMYTSTHMGVWVSRRPISNPLSRTLRCPRSWFLLCRTGRQVRDCQRQPCPQPPIQNQEDSVVVSWKIPAASPAPRVHKPKKPNDDFPLQKNNIA